jgi:hypothetical protein
MNREKLIDNSATKIDAFLKNINYDTIKNSDRNMIIISFDPAIKNMGVSVIILNPSNMDIIPSIESIMDNIIILHLDKLFISDTILKYTNDVTDLNNKCINTLNCLMDEINNKIDNYIEQSFHIGSKVEIPEKLDIHERLILIERQPDINTTTSVLTNIISSFFEFKNIVSKDIPNTVLILDATVKFSNFETNITNSSSKTKNERYSYNKKRSTNELKYIFTFSKNKLTDINKEDDIADALCLSFFILKQLIIKICLEKR